MARGDQLLFVNFSNPSEDARQDVYRKQVRSFVTKRQHRGRIERAGFTDDGSPAQSKADSQRKIEPANERKRQRRQSTNSAVISESRRSRLRRTKTDEDILHAAESPPLLVHVLDDPADHLNTCCKQMGQSIADCLHLMTNLVRALGPDLERKLNITPGLTEKHMVPMVQRSAALLAATALKCVTTICTLTGQSIRPAAFLEIRQFALARIREALEEGAITDEVLCAVSTLANFELVHNGNRALYHAHKKGLVKMIARRGGLDCLGNEGYTQATLLYNDANTARMAGCTPHLSVFRRVTDDVDPEFWLQGLQTPEIDKDSDEVVSTELDEEP